MGGGGGGGVSLPKVSVSSAVNPMSMVTDPLHNAVKKGASSLLNKGKSTTRVNTRTTPAQRQAASEKKRKANRPSVPGTVKAGAPVKLDSKGYQAYQNEALTPSSESPWLKIQQQRIEDEKRQGMDTAANMAAGQTAQARTSIAMRGGLSGGASERLAMTGAKNAMLGQQEVNRDARTGNLAAASTAEQNRLNMLQGLPGHELERGRFGQSERGYRTDVDKFNEDIKARTGAANAMADAYRNSGNRVGTASQMFGGDFSGIGANDPTNLAYASGITAPFKATADFGKKLFG